MGVSTPIDHRGATAVIASPATGTFTVSATANFLLVTLNFDQAAGMAVTAVTYNGVPMVACGATDTNATKNPYSAAFYLVNPPTGSALTISITISGTITDIYWDATTYSGVNVVTPIRAGTYQAPTNPTSTAGGTYAIAISSNTNDRTITVLNSPGGTTGSDQSGGGTYITTAGAYSGSMDYCTTPAASVTHTWSGLAATDNLSIVGFSLNGDPNTVTVVTPIFPPWTGRIKGPVGMVVRNMQTQLQLGAPSPVPPMVANVLQRPAKIGIGAVARRNQELLMQLGAPSPAAPVIVSPVNPIPIQIQSALRQFRNQTRAAVGPTTYFQSLDGGITPSGTLVKQTNKILAGGITPVGDLLKQVSRALTGGITPTGALLKQISRALTGGITPTGSLVKQIGKVFSGGLGPSGTLSRQTNKLLTGGITPTGILAAAKVTLANLVGSITPSGDLTSIYQAGAGFVADLINRFWPRRRRRRK